jgi:hypothetical protein
MVHAALPMIKRKHHLLELCVVLVVVGAAVQQWVAAVVTSKLARLGRQVFCTLLLLYSEVRHAGSNSSVWGRASGV